MVWSFSGNIFIMTSQHRYVNIIIDLDYAKEAKESKMSNTKYINENKENDKYYFKLGVSVA